jgi:UDP-3-O-[3-hydroxymyristoyl] N-acetylglucosamine deacetylase
LVLKHQTTLAGEARISGVGVHGGLPANLTLKPAAADTGVVFIRTDLPGRPSIAARADTVCDTRLATVIGDGSGATVATVEHLMSALAGMGVDNAIAEIDGPETPIGDGSATQFVTAI